MSDLPPALKAAKEKLRPRFEAQTERMAALAAASLAAELSAATVTHDLPIKEGLALLDAEAEKNS
ncbi:hypothetical protein OIU34_21270 [Pararhizobium sp. BT-229]|uniref:hypothetical protein n=1 Tax=Pararhizobium sp. BT-229 TaxID=2986923 RepID=UPI0021F6A9BF|nr:hypothetical protein [Pararhizobium sp. BT-229]MCV9964423.1 hypothetical protein [Pararhizobium sp. BT-229]